MKAFNIDKFCEETGYDKDQVSVTLNAASDHLYRMAFSKFIGHSAPLVDSIADAVEKKISGKNPSLALTDGKKNKKSRKGEFYAPYKEVIPCSIVSMTPINQNTATLVFESVNEREYGNGDPVKFTESVNYSAQQVTSLFYLLGGYDEIPTYTAREEVVQKIPNLPSPEDIPSLFMGFLYNVEVKRVVADYRDPVQIISITPCGVLQNANNQL